MLEYIVFIESIKVRHLLQTGELFVSNMPTHCLLANTLRLNHET